MRVSIYQPQYFPRLHYLNRVLDSDCFVIFSSAQYVKKFAGPDGNPQLSYQADTPVKLADGPTTLKVPVRKKPSYAPINEKQIDYSQDWTARHLRSLEGGYRRARYFEQRHPDVRRLLEPEWGSLAALNRQTILWALSLMMDLWIRVEDLSLDRLNAALEPGTTPGRLRYVVEDHELETRRPEGRQQGAAWTAAICAELGATEYLHGGTAQHGYMETDEYERRGIKPVLQEWQCKPYDQSFEQATGFVPNLSILDLLYNVDSATARDVLVP